MRPAYLAMALLLAATGCTGGSSTPTAANEVKVGVVLEFTGTTATYGEETWNGIQMAIEDLAPKSKWKFVLKRADNKSDPQECARAVNQLVEIEGVHAIIGAVASKNTKAGGRIANESGVPMISPGSTATDVTAIGPYISRVCFIDDFQGEVMANFAYKDLGKKTAAIVVDKSQDYCVGLADSFRRTYEKQGGKILTVVNYTSGESDFAALVEKVRAAAPECIWIPGYYGEVGVMLKQAVTAWKGLPKLGGDGWDSPSLFSLAGSRTALEDCYMSSHFAPDDEETTIKTFVERYRKKYSAEPGSMSVLGYDAMLLLQDALDRAGGPDRAKLKDAINATKGLKAITGVITLDQNRNPKKDAVILIPQDGKFKFKARVKAAES